MRMLLALAVLAVGVLGASKYSLLESECEDADGNKTCCPESFWTNTHIDVDSDGNEVLIEDENGWCQACSPINGCVEGMLHCSNDSDQWCEECLGAFELSTNGRTCSLPFEEPKEILGGALEFGVWEYRFTRQDPHAQEYQWLHYFDTTNGQPIDGRVPVGWKWERFATGAEHFECDDYNEFGDVLNICGPGKCCVRGKDKAAEFCEGSQECTSMSFIEEMPSTLVYQLGSEHYDPSCAESDCPTWRQPDKLFKYVILGDENAEFNNDQLGDDFYTSIFDPVYVLWTNSEGHAKDKAEIWTSSAHIGDSGAFTKDADDFTKFFNTAIPVKKFQRFCEDGSLKDCDGNCFGDCKVYGLPGSEKPLFEGCYKLVGDYVCDRGQRIMANGEFGPNLECEMFQDDDGDCQCEFDANGDATGRTMTCSGYCLSDNDCYSGFWGKDSCRAWLEDDICDYGQRISDVGITMHFECQRFGWDNGSCSQDDAECGADFSDDEEGSCPDPENQGSRNVDPAVEEYLSTPPPEPITPSPTPAVKQYTIIPNRCPDGSLKDCDGNCFNDCKVYGLPDSELPGFEGCMALVGDFVCDEGQRIMANGEFGPNLNCPLWNGDGGSSVAGSDGDCNCAEDRFMTCSGYCLSNDDCKSEFWGKDGCEDWLADDICDYGQRISDVGITMHFECDRYLYDNGACNQEAECDMNGNWADEEGSCPDAGGDANQNNRDVDWSKFPKPSPAPEPVSNVPVGGGGNAAAMQDYSVLKAEVEELKELIGSDLPDYVSPAEAKSRSSGWFGPGDNVQANYYHSGYFYPATVIDCQVDAMNYCIEGDHNIKVNYHDGDVQNDVHRDEIFTQKTFENSQYVWRINSSHDWDYVEVTDIDTDDEGRPSQYEVSKWGDTNWWVPASFDSIRQDFRFMLGDRVWAEKYGELQYHKGTVTAVKPWQGTHRYEVTYDTSDIENNVPAARMYFVHGKHSKDVTEDDVCSAKASCMAMDMEEVVEN